MATLNKQIKGFKSFYKSRDGARDTAAFDPAPLDRVPVYKYNWLGRKSKKATDQHGGRRGMEGGGGGGDGGEGMGGRKLLVVEGRKSVSHVETNLASVAAFLQVKVLVSDMPEMMQLQAFRSARRSYDSLEKFSSKHMAHSIKKVFFYISKFCGFSVRFFVFGPSNHFSFLFGLTVVYRRDFRNKSLMGFHKMKSFGQILTFATVFFCFLFWVLGISYWSGLRKCSKGKQNRRPLVCYFLPPFLVIFRKKKSMGNENHNF